jgi:FKBP-type peptidyl-prolyl cis-trans isomerase 2
MPFEKGSLIFANYTTKVKDTGESIDTTLEQEAKKLNIYDATKRYAPRLIAVGEGWLLAGLDEVVKDMDVGQRKEIELPPEKAYGKRDPTQTRMIPLRKFGERADDLAVGDSIDVDNRVGVVRFIGSGRAQVDFNHRLAGKSIVYDFEVLRKVEADDDKIRALIDRRFAGEGEKVSFTLKDDQLEIVVPEALFLTEGLQIIKKGISTDIFKFVPSVTSATFVEKFINEKPVPRVPPKAAEPVPKEKQVPKPRRRKATSAPKTG